MQQQQFTKWQKIKFLPFYLLSLLPARFLYGISTILYVFAYRLISYRKEVIIQNLNKAFPEYPKQRICAIKSDFYRHLTRLMAEILLLLTMSKRQMRKRLVITNPELLSELYSRHKSILLYAGHVGNWEWLAGLPLFTQHQVMALYQPLSNTYFNNLMRLIRSRFGVQCIPSSRGYRSIIEMTSKGIPSLSILIGDQCPTHESAKYWTTFMNQQTAFFVGAERLTTKGQLIALYPHFTKIKRGRYKVTLIPMQTKSPMPAFRLTEMYAKLLADNIQCQPSLWLWSHRRWKLKPATLS